MKYYVYDYYHADIANIKIDHPWETTPPRHEDEVYFDNLKATGVIPADARYNGIDHESIRFTTSHELPETDAIKLHVVSEPQPGSLAYAILYDE